MSGGLTAAGILAATAVVSTGVAAYEASTQSSAAGNQAKAAQTQLGMEQTQFGEQQQYAQKLQDLMANPSSVTSLPGYQFQFDQGKQALERSDAAGGFNGSGNMATDLIKYGQGYAMSAYDNQVQLLSSLAGFNAPAYGSNATGSANASTNSSNALFKNVGDSTSSLAWLLNRNSTPNVGSAWGGSSGVGSNVDFNTTDFSSGSLFGGASFPSSGFSGGGG